MVETTWRPRQPFGYGGDQEALDRITVLEAELADLRRKLAEAERERDEAIAVPQTLAAYDEHLGRWIRKAGQRLSRNLDLAAELEAAKARIAALEVKAGLVDEALPLVAGWRSDQRGARAAWLARYDEATKEKP